MVRSARGTLPPAIGLHFHADQAFLGCAMTNSQIEQIILAIYLYTELLQKVHTKDHDRFVSHAQMFEQGGV